MRIHTSVAAPIVAFLASSTLAHGDQQPIEESADWATRHLAEEHHINNFDASVFFTLHDYDSTGIWSPDDIRRTYGLFDESTRTIPEDKKASVVHVVMDIFDTNKDGVISTAEFVDGSNSGKSLPDFGTGPGHHGDDEYEYEIHHFEKYHGDDTTEEDLIHPEDIEHFKKHEEMEMKQEEWERSSRGGIIESNIPAKFRRPGS